MRTRRLPAALAGWPGWAAPAALAGAWTVGVIAAVLVAAAFGGANPAAARLALALLSAAGTIALLAWLAGRTSRAEVRLAERLGVRRCDWHRASAATAVAAALLALLCGLLALAGAFGGIRVPRELTRLDGLSWAAGSTRRRSRSTPPPPRACLRVQ